jgi:uncharacterized small protein (DUF1192 family)
MQIANIFRRAETAPPTAADIYAQVVALKQTGLSEIGAVVERRLSYATKINIDEEALQAAAQALVVAEKTYADARIAVALGDTLATPINVLRERRDAAKSRAAEAAQTASDNRAAMALFEEQIAKKRTALEVVKDQFGALVQPVLDERLSALAQRHERAEAEMREILREEAVLCAAFDKYSMANSVGEFRGSGEYADIRIPRPAHPAFIKTHTDPFERGKALEKQHADYRDEQRAIEWESNRLLGELMNGE